MKARNKYLLKSSYQIAEKVGAKAVFIYIDALDDLKYNEKIPKGIKTFFISKKKKWEFDKDETGTFAPDPESVIIVPRINYTRINLTKIAVMLAMAQEHISPGAIIVCLVGQTDTGFLDSIQIIDTSKETEIITSRSVMRLCETIKPEIFQTVLNLSVELAEKGREGKPVGTIFVVGDEKRVMQLSKQMIINPFKGYEEDERNILNPALKETIREFSAMDGAFIISEEGVVLTAGRYLSAAMEDSNLPRGLGSRHIAASGITALTNAIAFVISESSGDVRIFRKGKIIMEFEKVPTKNK